MPGFKFNVAVSLMSLAAVANAVVPDALLPPSGFDLKEALYAKGTQNYACNSTATPPAWVLTGPTANLYTSADYSDSSFVGTHYYAPTPDANGARVMWEDTKNSSVRAAPIKNIPSPDGPTNIPWLQLNVSATTPGRFEGIAYVLRIHTVGGVAPPASDCTAEKGGAEVKVDYETNYMFYKANGTTNGTPPTNSTTTPTTGNTVPAPPASGSGAPVNGQNSGAETLAWGVSTILGAASAALFWF
ncbi:hypothetical protein HK104_000101 [Borealophlyctis nickersoniae]|nr:hypothetical protein HK104_000101 [Borealophlyctis nickersoniae]